MMIEEKRIGIWLICLMIAELGKDNEFWWGNQYPNWSPSRVAMRFVPNCILKPRPNSDTDRVIII
jgi:hypothetical protein